MAARPYEILTFTGRGTGARDYQRLKAALAAAIGMSVWRAREAKTAETYGSAHWANASEVQSAGLLGSDGVVLGRYQRAYLRHRGPEHVLCFAPTRSGKGVGLVVPSLLTWPGSCIVHDIKGENWGLTAGFRSTLGRVLLFDPTNPSIRLQSAARGSPRCLGSDEELRRLSRREAVFQDSAETRTGPKSTSAMARCPQVARRAHFALQLPFGFIDA